jgi:hypothetical protein
VCSESPHTSSSMHVQPMPCTKPPSTCTQHGEQSLHATPPCTAVGKAILYVGSQPDRRHWPQVFKCCWSSCCPRVLLQCCAHALEQPGAVCVRTWPMSMAGFRDLPRSITMSARRICTRSGAAGCCYHRTGGDLHIWLDRESAQLATAAFGEENRADLHVLWGPANRMHNWQSPGSRLSGSRAQPRPQRRRR